MKTSLTIFKNLFAIKTDQRMDFDSFDELEKLLYKLSDQPLASKKDAVPLAKRIMLLSGLVGVLLMSMIMNQKVN